MKKAKDQPESEPAELASLVGERIRKIRKEEGLSLELFALRCDMNAAYVEHEVIDRLARAFYPAILACWNSEEGQREFAAWQAEQAHHTPSKEKQSVPNGERPVIHIAVVCGLWQGASGWAHPVFILNLKIKDRKVC